MSIPFEQIAGVALAQSRALVAEWLPNGKFSGQEYTCGSIHGEPGESLSINLTTGRWADFAGDIKGGDLIGLYAAIFCEKNRITAARELGKKLGVYMNGDASASTPPAPKETWVSCDPPHGVVAPDLSGWDMVHVYRNAAGEPIRYVCRRNKTEKSRKTFMPLTYGTLNGVQGWHRKQANEPRILYGLDRLAAMPERTVLICEGEKAADAAQAMFAEYPCISWTAGTGSVSRNDWSVLTGRRIIIWPDHDAPGAKAANELRTILKPIARAVETLRVDDLPDGADAADVSPDDPVAWLTDRLRPTPSDQDAAPEYEYPAEDMPEASSQTAEGIVPLGHDRGTYFYLSRATGQVEALPAAQHTRAMLTHLASETYYWQRTRFAGQKGVDWNSAADDLRVQCRAVGIFDPDRLRGRGAWLDGGKSVLHLGDRLLVDGQETQLLMPGSRYIYENSRRMNVAPEAPLSSVEAKRLMDLCCAAPWESPDHMGRLLAGWCVIAPVCGAMPWRPHLWLTSEAGAGKSYLLENIVKPILGAIALDVQSKTTEAGIRQALGCDARPVIFDEAETQNERDRDRIQLVLDLARQASSEEGAAIIKGSANGRAQSFRIRSCFAFSSINVGISQAADESRTVILTLTPNPDPVKREAAFAHLRSLLASVMVRDFPNRLLARTLSLLPEIRANAVVFAEAIARSGQSRRTGDTYGVILAGAWSLRSRAVATPEEADTFVAETAWVREAVGKSDAEPEWQRALSRLMAHRIRVAGGNGRVEDVPIGELIEASMMAVDEQSIPCHIAETYLSRVGLRVGATSETGDALLIANHSTACEEAFRGTPWAASWLRRLSATPGARANAKSVRMASGVTKALAIPVTALTG